MKALAGGNFSVFTHFKIKDAKIIAQLEVLILTHFDIEKFSKKSNKLVGKFFPPWYSEVCNMCNSTRKYSVDS